MSEITTESTQRNIALKIAYDGTHYHGFQRQPEFHGPTVQGSLESVWAKLVEEVVTLNTAGRTDRGVHATGQVVNFRTAARIPAAKIPKAMNSLLPRDIRVVDAQEVADSFHARFSARWKRYDYEIDNHTIADVFKRLYSVHVPVPLDWQRMQQAAQLMVGRHNFKAFSSVGGNSKTFERTLYVCQVTEHQGQIRITCIGDGFLYNMVRIIAGTLIYVGRKRIPPEAIPGILERGERKRGGPTAAPRGLTLSYVHYGEELPKDIFPEFYH
ncbi:pseudouridylate synthase I [Desulfitobacterium dichloroeliminans LMG P-21439]|uniref:tRNA pseudouridine synthase A n=1 Tax=Desulfitobacterium dichloroeliminans (strain LMG P-21439 / DCA1) TaxID=871963 RepID=L0F5X1_DESDL|nr:tRNA pseudouridine(38-40) synthase TruA [Desulfitobacterium dichloroeliminans]AGA68026.1 pseudouridylate synthase I [Desulfitobacterium dichloroeliminans LMG P-21439]